MKKKKLFPLGLSKNAKTAITFIAMIIVICFILFCSAIITGCSSQNATASDTSSQEEMIFELKCKLENQKKLVRAYQNVLHQVWLDKPNYVEDALSETDEFCDLNEIMGETDVFQLRNAEDSLRYKYQWFHETDDQL